MFRFGLNLGLANTIKVVIRVTIRYLSPGSYIYTTASGDTYSLKVN